LTASALGAKDPCTYTDRSADPAPAHWHGIFIRRFGRPPQVIKLALAMAKLSVNAAKQVRLATAPTLEGDR
jgi:hypothetical protein